MTTTILPAPDSCQTRGQAPSVNGDRRPSAEQTRSAVDRPGLDRTLPAAGAGSPVLYRPGLRTTAKSSRRPELSPNQEKR